MKKKKRTESIDTGTTELHHRHKSIVERTRSGQIRIRLTDGCEIDRLLWTERLSPEDHSTLTGFQIDAHRAGLISPRAQSLEPRTSVGAPEISHNEAVLRLKHGQACAHVKKFCGAHVLSRLLAICLDDKPARAEDVPLLQRACVSLAQFRATWSSPD